MFTSLDMPLFKVQDVINSIKSSYKTKRGYYSSLSEEYEKEMSVHEKEYLEFNNCFYLLKPEDNVEGVKKKEANFFYESKIVSEKVDNIYHEILETNDNICPICEAIADSLDHILPKEKYTQFAITPINLIPMCTTCNKKKHTHYSYNEGESVFHPYFDKFSLIGNLTAGYEIDSSERFVVIYNLKSEVSDKFKYNFENVFKINKVCSILAQRKIKYWIVMSKKIARLKSGNDEQLKKRIYEKIQKKYDSLEGLIDDEWEIALYRLILEEYNTFFDYVIKREL